MQSKAWKVLARKLELDVIRDEIDSAKVPQLRIGHNGAAVSAVNNPWSSATSEGSID